MITEQQRAAAFVRLNELNRQGRLTPAIVVYEARDPKSPLRVGWAWTWSRNEAAQRWLEHQARKFIESYRVYANVREIAVEDRGAVVAFVHDPGLPEGVAGFIASDRVHGEAAEHALAEELKRIEGHVARGWALAQQWGLENKFIAAVEKMLGGLA